MSDETIDINDPANFRRATITWQGGLVFSGGTPDGSHITLDGKGKQGPGMVVALLHAAASCSAADVVSILEKMKVELESCVIDIVGRRNSDYPKRFNQLTLRFTLKGKGVTQKNAERAVELSVTKYCSVLSTLDPNMPVETEVVIEG